MSRLIVLVLVAVLGAIANKSNEVNGGEVIELQESLASANNIAEEIQPVQEDVMNKRPEESTGKKGKKGKKEKGRKQNKMRPTPNDANGNKTRGGYTTYTSGEVAGCHREFPKIWRIYSSSVGYGGHVHAGVSFSSGHDVPELSCISSGSYYYAQKKYSGWRAIGSFIVNPGCSVYFFQHYDYTGTYVKYIGPRIVYNLRPGGAIHKCGNGFTCVASMLWTCKQTYPSCTPTDSWQTIAEIDNSGSPISTVFTYEKTVGTTFSQSMKDAISVDRKVDAAWKATWYWAIMSMGKSARTGYDWSQTSSESKSKAHTFVAELTVPARKKTVVQQVVGTCGESTIHTQMFRITNK